MLLLLLLPLVAQAQTISDATNTINSLLSAGNLTSPGTLNLMSLPLGNLTNTNTTSTTTNTVVNPANTAGSNPANPASTAGSSSSVPEDTLVYVTCRAGVAVGRRSPLPAPSMIGGVQQNYYRFLGIPYAEAPVDNLRLRAPLPKHSWGGTRMFLQDMPLCTQPDLTSQSPNSTLGQEDCLYLNVYTPFVPSDRIIQNELLPVMVWIHGGGYQFGSAREDRYDPSQFMDKGVVVVSINYRLGYLGFMAQHSNPDLHGNMGLADQQVALEWVQRNIEYFGGDRGSVTLAGQEAGGHSVNMHMLSTRGRHLFHHAIAQSGSALTGYLFQRDKHMFRHSDEFLNKVGCSTAKDVFECLQKVPVETFIEHGRNQRFMPTTDKGARTPYLPADVYECLKTGEFDAGKPILFGHSEDEGLLPLLKITQNFSDVSVLSQLTAKEIYNLDSMHEEDMWLNKTAANALVKYCNEAKNLSCLLELLTDSQVAGPMHTTSRLMAQRNPHVFRYTLKGRCSDLSAAHHYPGVDAMAAGKVITGDDLPCLFPNAFGIRHPRTPEQTQLSNSLVTLWASHVRNAPPTWSNVRGRYGCNADVSASGQMAARCNVATDPTWGKVWNKRMCRMHIWEAGLYDVVRRQLHMEDPMEPSSGVMPAFATVP